MFALIGLIWNIWFGMFGWRGLVRQKILAKKDLVENLGEKNVVQKIIRIWSRKLLKKNGPKNVVQKSFWSQTILPEKICIQKYLVTSIKILVPRSLRHRVK